MARGKTNYQNDLYAPVRRQKLENQAVIKATGRARRKKGGNYTAYGQTGGALAPDALAAGRAPVGKSHGVAIVKGAGGYGNAAPNPLGKGRVPRPKLFGSVDFTQQERAENRKRMKQTKRQPRHYL